MCINAPIVSLKRLRALSWDGIPRQYRAMSWKLLLGYVPTNRSRQVSYVRRRREEYWQGLQKHYYVDENVRAVNEKTILHNVTMDVPRTAPCLRLFSDKRILASIERVLFLWAVRNPASSYVQGINDLVTPFFTVFLGDYYGDKDMTNGEGMDLVPDDILSQVEADCYGCLTNLMSGIQDHYTPDQPGIHRMVLKLEKLVEEHNSDLSLHLKSTGLEFLWFSFKWMNCFLMRELSLPCVIRMWDTYFSEESFGFQDFHVYVCAALLGQFSETLKVMEFEGLFEFIQNLPTEHWGEVDIGMLLDQANAMRSNEKDVTYYSVKIEDFSSAKKNLEETGQIIRKTLSANVLYDPAILWTSYC